MKPQIRMFNRIGFVREIPKDVENTRVIPFTISNSTRDRHKTVLNMDNWNLDNYKANPIVGYQHQVYGGFFRNDPDFVIGTSDVSIQEKELIGAVKFEPEKINPLAEKIFRKVLHGTLRAASVGFIPVGNGKFGEGEEAQDKANETYYYEGQELLEWSIVNIGSNPTAVKRNILSQFGEILLSYFPIDDIKKMSIEELLNYIEAAEETESADERPYPNEHAARIRDPKDFEQDSFRRKNVDKGVDVIFGRLKGETTTTTQAYRFKKDVFTVEEAKKWLKDHKIEYISFEPASEKEIDSNYHKRKRELDLLTI